MKDIIKRNIERVTNFSQKELRNELSQQTKQLENIKDLLSQKDNRLDDLKVLIEKVEHYQPIYGITGLIKNPARQSDDRCRAIYDALGDVSGMNVLDIGSSLGYNSFYLADRGAHVEGWDYNLDNAEISRQVSAITGIRANFLTKELNKETVSTIPDDYFDVVMVLSVFHHTIALQSLEQTKFLVKELLNRSPVMIVELAKKGEDKNLYWDKSQPDNELEIFDGLDVDIKEIGKFSNHLSSNKRALYLIERKKIVTVNGKKYNYLRKTQKAYKKSPVGEIEELKRRYYFTKNHVIKEYGTTTNAEKLMNNIELFNEVSGMIALHKLRVLQKLDIELPRLIDIEYGKKTTKIVLEKKAGKLLSEYIDDPGQQSKEEIANTANIVLRSVLKQLAGLEKLGVFHGDIRPWNIIVSKNNEDALLIDYGSMSPINFDNDLQSLVRTIIEYIDDVKIVEFNFGSINQNKYKQHKLLTGLIKELKNNKKIKASEVMQKLQII